MRLGAKVSHMNVARQAAPGHFQWEDGPWTIERVISAVSGPGYYAAAIHDTTREQVAGYVYERHGIQGDA